MEAAEKAQNKLIFIVLIYLYKDSKDHPGYSLKYTCTGSLLREDVVLTAAHCIPDNVREIKITFLSGVVRQVINFYIHPQWPNPMYDIAVLTFPSTNVKDNLSLPTVPLTSTTSNCATGGFGDPSASLDTYKYIVLGTKNATILLVGNSWINVYYTGIHPCKGDSGGPLYCNSYIYGVLSTASTDNCTAKSTVTSYISTIKHKEWIGTFLTLPETHPPPDNTTYIVFTVLYILIILLIILCFSYLIKKYF